MVGMTIVTIPLMDRAGRRTLHLCGLAGMFIFSIVFTITFSLNVSIPAIYLIQKMAMLGSKILHCEPLNSKNEWLDRISFVSWGFTLLEIKPDLGWSGGSPRRGDPRGGRYIRWNPKNLKSILEIGIFLWSWNNYNLKTRQKYFFSLRFIQNVDVHTFKYVAGEGRRPAVRGYCQCAHCGGVLCSWSRWDFIFSDN